MAVYKEPKPTKNGRAWYFKFSYKDAFGSTKQYRSKRYLTKKEASDAERMFLVTSTDKVEDNNMTFKDLYDEFRMHNNEIMKDTTKYGYDNKEKFIECFFTVKLKDFNYPTFERWHDETNSTHLATRTKNDIYKLLKTILNYATAWHEFSFAKVYPKMYNFNDPNEFPKEQLFFTYEEFKQFLSVETDIKWIGIFEILYYCGLRRGELRGLQWKDINFKDRTLSITKQINDRCGSVKNWRFSVPKTKSSIRILKMPQVLTNDLKMMKKQGRKDTWI